MNQKSWAIISVAFIAGLMIFSSFAGFVMRGGAPVEQKTSSGEGSLSDFGMGNVRLIDWYFDNVGDVLGMYPEDLVFAYWVDLNASENLTSAARLALPPSFGLTYRDQVKIYSTEIEQASWGLFGDQQAEFHWIKPYPIGSYGLTIPYSGYQMIPINADIYTVMGMPTLLGEEQSVKNVLDVIVGVSPTTEEFILPYDEVDDLQISGLGRKATDNPHYQPPLGGDYREFYLGISQMDDAYHLTAKYLQPNGETETRIKEQVTKQNLQLTSEDGMIKVSGRIEPENLDDALVAWIIP